MAEFLFHKAVAYDPATNTLVTSATGKVYAPDDLNTPLTVRTLDGADVVDIVVSEHGLTAEFITVDIPEVVWRSGPYSVAMFSMRSMADAVTAAAVQVAASAAAAASAELAANAAAAAAAADALLPPGGTTGQVLVKVSGEDSAVGWADPSGGGTGTGDGTVKSINQFGPDLEGDVELDAGKVGAAPTVHGHPADQITTDGTQKLPVAAVPDLPAGRITTGTFEAGRIPNLDAGKIASGTIAAARLPQYVQTINDEDGQVDISPEGLEAVRNITPDDFGGIGVGTELPTAGAGKRLFVLIPE